MEQISVKIQRLFIKERIELTLNFILPIRPGRGAHGYWKRRTALSHYLSGEARDTRFIAKRCSGSERALQQAGLDTNSNSFNFGLKNNGAQQPSQDHKNANNSDQNLSENLALPSMTQTLILYFSAKIKRDGNNLQIV